MKNTNIVKKVVSSTGPISYTAPTQTGGGAVPFASRRGMYKLEDDENPSFGGYAGVDAGGLAIKSVEYGETISNYSPVYLKADGKWWKADADAIATCGLLGLKTDKGTVINGFVTNASWSWTAGGAIYISTVDGTLTQTAPSGEDDVIAVVGWAITATKIYFNPDNTRIEYKA